MIRDGYVYMNIYFFYHNNVLSNKMKKNIHELTFWYLFISLSLQRLTYPGPIQSVSFLWYVVLIESTLAIPNDPRINDHEVRAYLIYNFSSFARGQLPWKITTTTKCA